MRFHGRHGNHKFYLLPIVFTLRLTYCKTYFISFFFFFMSSFIETMIFLSCNKVAESFFILVVMYILYITEIVRQMKLNLRFMLVNLNMQFWINIESKETYFVFEYINFINSLICTFCHRRQLHAQKRKSDIHLNN